MTDLMNKYVEALVAARLCEHNYDTKASCERALAALVRTLREDDGAVAAIMNANSMVLRKAASAQRNALCDYLGSDE